MNQKVQTKKYSAKPGKRIDLQIMELEQNLSRTTIKKLIIEGVITVNGSQVMPNYRPKEGDIIEIAESTIQNSLEDHEQSLLQPTDLHIEILYEDEDTIVGYKPEGMAAHPQNKFDTESFINGLYYHVQNHSTFDRTKRLRLVHRIDKETSGILLASKTLEAHDFYAKQFEEHSVIKQYVAIVYGDFSAFLNGKPQFDYTTYISQKPRKNKYHNTSPQHGRIAQSRFYFERFVPDLFKKQCSQVLVEIKTGRTHQIRVHLSSLGFPIIGDELYGGKPFTRTLLHAKSLTFEKYHDKSKITIEAPLPKEFET